MSEEWIWEQRGALGKTSVLTDNGQVIASLSFESHFARQAEGEYPSTKLRFIREGLVHPLTRVLRSPMDEQVATIRLKWKYSLKAEIELANGTVLQVHCRGFTSRTWTIKDREGRKLCTLSERWKLLRSTGTFRKADLRAGDPDATLLALITWYIINIISYQESSVAAWAGRSSPRPGN